MPRFGIDQCTIKTGTFILLIIFRALLNRDVTGSVAEVTFPEEGTYFGNDHDLGRLLNGAGFVILATRNSTTDDHPNGR